MDYTVSITSQGQISIPAKVRRELKLHRHRKATLKVRGQEIIITPPVDVSSLRGSLASAHPIIPIDTIHEEFEKNLLKF